MSLTVCNSFFFMRVHFEAPVPHRGFDDIRVAVEVHVPRA